MNSILILMTKEGEIPLVDISAESLLTNQSATDKLLSATIQLCSKEVDESYSHMSRLDITKLTLNPPSSPNSLALNSIETWKAFCFR